MLSLTPEHTALGDSAARFIAEHYDPSTHRDRLAHPTALDPQRWRDMAELGWLGIAIDEAAGGSGLGYSYASVLAEALGPALMREPLLSQVAFAGHLVQRASPETARDALLQRWLRGELLVALVVLDAPTQGDAVSGSDPAVMDGGIADYLLISGAAPQRIFLLPAVSDGICIEAERTFDGRHIAVVNLDAVDLARALVLEYDDATQTVVEEAQVLNRLLLVSESLGIARALVRGTHNYLHDREQFGTTIGTFQALQHRLVDMLLALTRAESLVELWRLKCDAVGLGAAVMDAATIGVVDACQHIAREAIQLHGAIAMTDEFIVGHYLKRLTANEILLGGIDAPMDRRIAYLTADSAC